MSKQEDERRGKTDDDGYSPRSRFAERIWDKLENHTDRIAKAETEIAVQRAEFREHLKITSDIQEGLKDVKDMGVNTSRVLGDFIKSNEDQHKELTRRVNFLTSVPAKIVIIIIGIGSLSNAGTSIAKVANAVVRFIERRLQMP